MLKSVVFVIILFNKQMAYNTGCRLTSERYGRNRIAGYTSQCCNAYKNCENNKPYRRCVSVFESVNARLDILITAFYEFMNFAVREVGKNND